MDPGHADETRRRGVRDRASPPCLRPCLRVRHEHAPRPLRPHHPLIGHENTL